ncbi:hypothetical protein AB0878_21545 [Amycolatopsis sp. NPDC047767]|uniref:hypothetical protein n=1 Tax=Amycolatopsis sp. NPDC047767 TaxID=3156765 RepID=UPI003456EEBA
MRIWRKARAAVLALALVGSTAATPASGTATDCCGGPSSWTTGDKSALGTSATTQSPVWFTVADGVTSEVFYPRVDVPETQDMQYVVTDGSSFVDLERDATDHAVSMPDEKSLEYTVTNTAKSGRYRITTTYVTDPARATLVTRTRFQALDSGTYRLYLLANPSMAGGAGGDTASWDGNGLVASGTENLFGTTTTVVSSLRASTGFSAHDNGYSGAASDCLVDLRADHRLDNGFDAVSGAGNVVQCGQIPVAADTTFTVALGYGSTAQAATSAATGSLTAGFSALEAGYRTGWNSYVGSLKPAPASVAGDQQRRRAYYVAAMALHAAEDKTFRGAGWPGWRRRGATSSTATASATVTTGCGVATSTNRPPVSWPPATRRSRNAWRSSCGTRSGSARRPPATARRTRPARSPATAP